MSMYECEECGMDECTFPGIFLAVNTTDSVFPYHNTEFEQSFDEIRSDESDLDKAWAGFW